MLAIRQLGYSHSMVPTSLPPTAASARVLPLTAPTDGCRCNVQRSNSTHGVCSRSVADVGRFVHNTSGLRCGVRDSIVKGVGAPPRSGEAEGARRVDTASDDGQTSASPPGVALPGGRTQGPAAVPGANKQAETCFCGEARDDLVEPDTCSSGALGRRGEAPSAERARSKS